jgi:hypothetical protein
VRLGEGFIRRYSAKEMCRADGDLGIEITWKTLNTEITEKGHRGHGEAAIRWASPLPIGFGMRKRRAWQNGTRPYTVSARVCEVELLETRARITDRVADRSQP